MAPCDRTLGAALTCAGVASCCYASQRPRHHLPTYQRQLKDGSYLACYQPSPAHSHQAIGPLWVRVDEGSLDRSSVARALFTGQPSCAQKAVSQVQAQVLQRSCFPSFRANRSVSGFCRSSYLTSIAPCGRPFPNKLLTKRRGKKCMFERRNEDVYKNGLPRELSILVSPQSIMNFEAYAEVARFCQWFQYCHLAYE